MAQIIPTRMELLKVKGRIKLASKGHSLLKRKRDVLIMELFSILKKAKDVRAELNEMLKEAHVYLYYTLTEYMDAEIASFAASTLLNYTLEVKTKNVMGVHIPEMAFKVKGLKRPKNMPPLVDFVIEKYIEILKHIIATAEVEVVVKRLLAEIETTKRRVNALEYVVIPSLEEQKKLISQKLEELERDAFVSLKSLKSKMANR